MYFLPYTRGDWNRILKQNITLNRSYTLGRGGLKIELKVLLYWLKCYVFESIFYYWTTVKFLLFLRLSEICCLTSLGAILCLQFVFVSEFYKHFLAKKLQRNTIKEPIWENSFCLTIRAVFSNKIYKICQSKDN